MKLNVSSPEQIMGKVSQLTKIVGSAANMEKFISTICSIIQSDSTAPEGFDVKVIKVSIISEYYPYFGGMEANY